ncbi:MAG: AraC family transcriptional regulator ligand-binding domain-containing protein [Alphaproteobacteria bacterium]|nr:AraC family transcriptional regulator ligand-binding domain-containing protein [Alphaproteobacteria bacterium]
MSDVVGTVDDTRRTIAGLISGVVIFALSKGIPMERITEVTGLGPADILQPEGWLPEDVMPAVWRLIEAACPGQAVALEMAAAAPQDLMGAPQQAARLAPNLRAAVEAFVTHRQLISERLQLTLVEGEGELTLRMFHPTDALDGGHTAELSLALGLRALGEHGHRIDALVRVELAHPPHGPVADYEAFFKAPVRFERPVNALVFRQEVAERPVRAVDPALQAYVRAQLDIAAKRLAASGRAHALAPVRQAIAEGAAEGDYDAGNLARRLGMSLRTLQRRVRAHGANVRALLDEAREANARQLLADDRLSIEEVAASLGYSDQRAFRRAFKRWTGTTPGALR